MYHYVRPSRGLSDFAHNTSPGLHTYQQAIAAARAEQAQRQMDYWFAYYRGHCPYCDGAYNTMNEDHCPHCGQDFIPF